MGAKRCPIAITDAHTLLSPYPYEFFILIFLLECLSLSEVTSTLVDCKRSIYLLSDNIPLVAGKLRFDYTDFIRSLASIAEIRSEEGERRRNVVVRMEVRYESMDYYVFHVLLLFSC